MEFQCRVIVQRRCTSCCWSVENIPLQAERRSAGREKLFAFLPESTFTFRPECCSGSQRNGVRLQTGIAFAFDRIPQIAGLTAIGTSNFDDAKRVDNVFVFENILRIARGRHLITAGGRGGATQVNAETTTAFVGNYLFSGAASGNAFADFLLGDPSSFLQIGGDSGRGFRSKDFAYFVQAQ